MSLVIIVPILNRAHRVEPLVASIRATCAGRVLFGVTTGDDEVKAAVLAAGCDLIEVPWAPGDFGRKVNTAYRASSEEHMFLGADDVLFHPGWYEAAVAKLTPGIGVVGTNDLGSQRVMRGEHATHSLVTRAYADEFGTIDRPGEILHEGYPHEYSDDELVATAKFRGAWAFAADSIVEHLHPNWGKAPTDEIYQRQGVNMRAGSAIFQRRKRLWTR